MSKKDLIKRLKSDRKQVVSQLDRFYEFISGCDQLTNKITINERFLKCETLWDDFNKIQVELDFLEDSSDQPVSERLTFEEKYFETVCRFKELMNINSAPNLLNTNVNASINTAYNPVRLPSLDLPSFDGSYEKWTSFFDTFLALIHSNNSLTNVQKFYYLQSCLKGEAAQVISSILVTDLNYEIAFNLLRERYENKRLIVHSHLRAIFDMPSVGKNCHVDLRTCLDIIQKNVRALKSLKEPVEYWDTILVFLCNLKLDINSKREWEAHSIKNNTSKYEDFIKFVTERCQILESVESNKANITGKPSGSSNNNSYSKSPKYTSRSFLTGRNQCLICSNGEHWFSNCPKFLKFSESQRIDEIKKLHLCLNCFKSNHLSTRCTQTGCKKCGKPHNVLLHLDFSKSRLPQSNTESKNNSLINNNGVVQDKTSAHILTSEELIVENDSKQQDYSVSTSVNAHNANNSFNSEVLLSTAKVLVFDTNGQSHELRALLDCGSQSNFISNNAVQRLGVNTNEINLSVTGINSSVTKCTRSVWLKIQSKFNSFSVNLQFFVLNKISNKLPIFSINKKVLKIPSNIQLADDSFNIPGEIDLLLGANIFYDLLSFGQIRTADESPIFQKTKFGWITSGSVPISNKNKNSVCNTVCGFFSNISVQKQMEKFWEIEDIQTLKILTKEEKECEINFINTTKRANDNRFIVELPTKDGIKEIGDSEDMAIRRFNKLEKNKLANEDIKSQYIEFMTEYENLGHMSEIPEDEIHSKENIVYYLPHHPVIKETSSTTKLRVVFDASAKTSNGISLNEKLKSGPVIQDELYSILVRFRQHNCVLGADIEKMYRQVWVKEEQRDLQRIVWRSNPEEKLRHYKLNTLTYGTTPASFLAIRSLHMAAEEAENKYPNASNEIKRNFYVDDLLTGTSTVDEARKLKDEISEILEKSGFVLRKWISNKNEVFNDKRESMEVKHYIVKDKITKTLGIAWNIKEDSLQYSVQASRNMKPTKRNILSVISRVFDPLGLIGPIIIQAKIIMQKLWSEKLDWDDEISSDLFKIWTKFYNELPLLNELSVNRHVLCDNPISIELHAFCDASEQAYGACVYCRSINAEGKIKTHLLCAKSKVAPIKTITLPRLELCGALLLSRLVTKTVESLTININKIYYWTDSKIVLAWLSSEPANWNVFVSHRVAEVQQNTDIRNWSHVISGENPADLISRGCSPEKIMSTSLWWNGPWWLSKKCEEWPNNKVEINYEEIPEKRLRRQVLMVILEQNIFDKFSSFSKLQRVVAFCLRFYKNLTSNKNNKVTGNLAPIELESSLICLVKIAQNLSFCSEINALTANKPILKSSKLLCLNPFLDKYGVLRVGGRLTKLSSISFNQKFPIILDKGHILSTLIISYEHKRNLHMGAQNLLSTIRSKFWILGGLNAIKRVLRSCIICFKVKPKGFQTIMGELPEQRLIPTKPFFNTGVDYAGPFHIKSSPLRNAKSLKCYLCLFVCFVTKAVHLEVVSDLSTEAFLNTLKRFIARRGKCQNMFSDCGSNFVGANNEMREFFKLINDPKCKDKVANCLAHEGIKWNFIPARSPHFGGLWESHVKIAKYHLKRIVGNAFLTFEELSTIFAQIEACMNSRPLSPLSNDPSDLSPLTPGHFLVGEPLVALPEPDVRDVKVNRLNRFERLNQVVQHFWDRWHRECLSNLNTRSKWQCQVNPNIKIDDLVVLREENLPPLKWALGRVVSVFPGSDNIVRVVSVKTEKGIVKRAASKVCVLPLDM